MKFLHRTTQADIHKKVGQKRPAFAGRFYMLSAFHHHG